MEKKNKVMFLIIGVCLLLILVGGITYAYFTAGIQTNNEENKLTDISTSTITKVTMDLGSKVNANGVLPGYKVVKTIRVTGDGSEDSLPVHMSIVLTPEVTDFPNHVKYYVYEMETKNAIDASSICTESKEITDGGVYYDAMTCNTASLGSPILEGTFVGTTSVSKEIEVTYNTDKTYYVLIEYVNDENADQNSEKGKYFEVTIDCGEHYKEEILHGTDPVLGEGLIPVTIDESGVVRKANLTKKWYEYSNQEWANAVILVDESISYISDEEIPEENIESYFVWIPRYKYKIFNDGNYTTLTSVENKVQTIEIEFESKKVEASEGSKVGDWLTHPAFTSFDVNGMWVGKFETGYKGATTTTEAEQNIVNTEKVQIKPNVYSWRNIQVANAHLNSYNYKRELDSHMMKNTEWGAVSYLSHSIYGSQTSVRINNNSAYITGYAAKNEPTCGYTGDNQACNIQESTSLGVDGGNTYNYFNNLSNLASTTGNKTGVYDMSGGSWEYVMGVMLDENGNLVSGRNDKWNSNFIGTLTNPNTGNNQNKTSWTEADGGIPYPESKYYDTYQYSTTYQEFNRRILGDATGEMGFFANATYGSQTRQISSWYRNEAWFVYSIGPWFMRGGDFTNGLGTGAFAFGQTYGHSDSYFGFRIVLQV